MQKVIFDASFFLSYLLPDEQQSNVEVINRFKRNKLTLVEPFIFSLEVVNGLRYAFASQRIPKKKLVDIVKLFQKLKNINYIYDFDLDKLTRLAVENDLSIYDACYLYLYKKNKVKLYSLDKHLQTAVST